MASSEPELLMSAALEESVLDDTPLTVPVEGVHAWELPRGHQIRLAPHLLPREHTIVAWLRLDSDDDGFKPLLTCGNNHALIVSTDLRPGVTIKDGSVTRFAESEHALPTDQWLMLASVGRGSSSLVSGGGSTWFYVGTPESTAMTEVGNVELCAAGMEIQRV